MSRFNRPPPRRWTEDEAQAHMRFYGNGKAVTAASATATMQRPNRQQCITLVLPFPPTTNSDKEPNGNGGQVLTEETRAFRRAVDSIVLAARAPWVDGRITVAIALYPSDNRAYDIDNRIKPTLDALQHAGVFSNDRKVKRLIVEEVAVRPPGEAVVTIEAQP